jgi:flavorubredoxin
VNAPEKVYIGYVCCYGYTCKLAQKIYEGVVSTGVPAEMEDVSGITADEAAGKIMGADAFALGSPTLNRDALPPIWDIMARLSAYVLKGKPAAVFGTYGWSGEAAKYMEQRLGNLGANVLGAAKAKMNPNEAELKEAYELGVKLGGSVK